MSGRPLAALAALALVATACGAARQEASGPPPTPSAGSRLFHTQGCPACHGLGRSGTSLAPPLEELTRHWGEDALVSFMRDPAPHLERDPRLARLAASYPARMPAVALADARLRELARFLLAAEPPPLALSPQTP